MKKPAVLIALGLGVAFLTGCATPASAPQIPQAVTAPSAAQSQAVTSLEYASASSANQSAGIKPDALIGKAKAEKIALKAYHQHCKCTGGAVHQAELHHGQPPYWEIEIEYHHDLESLQTCDEAEVWVNARNGKVIYFHCDH